jgi:8-amino-7-oxononanoate synthase
MKLFRDELKRLKEQGLLRRLTTIEPLYGSRISIDGRTFINFSSNDYLGLSRHPEIIKTAIYAIERAGIGTGASRLLSGTYPCHRRLEDLVSRFKNTERAVVFGSGYSANTGVIPAISGDDTTIFSDELNHASIIDGIRLSKAETYIYKHRDIEHLELLIKGSFKNRGIKKRFIITDAVFSMDGDLAPLKEIIEISRRYNAILMIDDAHGTGVLGRRGRGTLEHLGLDGGGIIQMGTFSKALGCFGGFVAGSSELLEFLINRARSFIYSTSLPPVIIEACLRAIEIVDTDSQELREKLWKNRQRLYEGLRALGYNTMGSETQIIPVLTGGVDDTLRLSRYLYKKGVFAPAIRPPTVPEGKCRIRFSVTAMHTEDDIDMVLESLKRFKKNKLRC